MIKSIIGTSKNDSSRLNADEVLKLDQNKKTLVVVNTVRKADELYAALKNAGKNVHLIHSRFIRRDRRQKEKDINAFSKNTKTGIWIGTQVVEASLDIDFDLLITELSELSSLFQRMGRCYRKRNYEGKILMFTFLTAETRPPAELIALKIR